MDKKKVGILLRVSDKIQANMQNNEPDIPTQRTACIRYMEHHPDWEFEEEYIEVGSAFKNKLNDRDKLLEVQEDIRNGRIDVLLVFMFDRLGRRDEETPFVVKSFVDMGCEVWSVKEGQQKFDEHIDYLLNYLRYWQASGESKKTSIRVTEAMTQMAEAGKYTGGKTPYGYQVVPTGNTTKKGLPEKTLEVNEDEARIVRTVFNLAVTHGYGCHRITTYLNEHAMFTKSGKQWGHAAVSNMLKNPIYKGVKAYNRTTAKESGKNQHRVSQDNWTLSPPNPAWAIVSEDAWDQVQRTLQARVKKQQEQYEYNQTLTDVVLGRTKLLFADYAYCGCCGAKMITGYSPYRWKTGDGVTHRRNNPVYKCNAKTSGKLGCEAKSSYRPDGIEGIVLEEVRTYLEKLKAVDLSAEITRLQKENTAYEEKAIKRTQAELSAVIAEYQKLKDEVVRVLMGESKFDADMLNGIIAEKAEKISSLQFKLEEAETALENKKLEHADLVQLQNMIPVWTEEFDYAPFDVKKVLLSKIIERVVIHRDKVEIKLCMHIQDFLSGSGGGSDTNGGGGKDLTTNGVDWRPY